MVRKEQPAVLDTLRDLVNIESGSHDKAGLDKLADLIRALQEPPVRTFGVFDVDTFFPAAERRDLALALNGLMAAPGFAAWLQGTPLDIDVLLGSGDGRPRHAIMSIAHLDDAQRMFFVTLLLESLLADGQLPTRYDIVELSAELAQRQRACLLARRYHLGVCGHR